jgi:HK97 gp10 family phage protein
MNLKAAFKVSDLRRLNNKLRKMDVDMRRESTKQLTKAAMAIRNDAVMAIRNPPKTGTQYGKMRDIKKVNWNLKGADAARKRIHQASAPGEAPAWDTGHLAGSISVVSDETRVAATVAVKADYASALEFGTRNMGERPFLRPAIEKNKHLIPKYIKDAFSVAKPKKG